MSPKNRLTIHSYNSNILVMRLSVKSKMKIIIKLMLALAILSCLASCSRVVNPLEKESLFTLNYGKMEGQLDFIVQPDSAAFVKNDFIHSNGLFYIADSRQNKIIVLSGQGDLLASYYNENDNPEPITLYKKNENENLASNLNAYPHPFINVRNIIVDSKKRLIVDEAVDSGRVEIDKNNGDLLNRTVRRFSSSGEFLNDLGQEGVGGVPFPYIHSLQVTKGDQLTVVSRTKDLWYVFSYNQEGEPIFNLSFNDEKLPTVVDGRLASLEEITLGYQNKQLYLKINFYEYESSNGKRVGAGVQFSDSTIWVYDLVENKFVANFDLPKKLLFDDGNRYKREVLYESVGMDSKGHLYFLAPNDETSYELLAVNGLGEVLGRIRIASGERSDYDKFYNISSEGVFSALILHKDYVEVARWRTDLAVGGLAR